MEDKLMEDSPLLYAMLRFICAISPDFTKKEPGCKSSSLGTTLQVYRVMKKKQLMHKNVLWKSWRNYAEGII
jgi:hypothetical protein